MSSDPSGRKGYGRIAPSSVRVRALHPPPQAAGIRCTASVLGRMREVPMRDERLEVSVTFDERRGYIGTAPELRQPVLALSLGGLRNLRTPSAMARQILFCASSFESASQRHDAFGGVRQRATEDAVIPSAPH